MQEPRGCPGLFAFWGGVLRQAARYRENVSTTALAAASFGKGRKVPPTLPESLITCTV
ncbi:hypothetical protein THS5294_03038 [Thalassobacter stenotrophicus]|uniref:Uncharacterized protein n=2 Tax=Thalassobacter stenotrophicus TaxID=266809 RepID=A0A0P1FR44_9RHOB|nr:hypothetical protein THS5294_03038 [Thalassobacter stenotrophicus]SHI43723.1 hypothetical protein SAMN02744035_00596 [Thalassobacter stenotrophicus DSM 16310]